jgi:dihydroneopterin aldolase
MSATVTIQDLEFQGFCGVLLAERQRPQPLAIDLELDYRSGDAALASGTDAIQQAIDYQAVSARLIELGQNESCALLETLAQRMLDLVFQEFAVESARLWLRKTSAVVSGVHGSVGVRLSQARGGTGRAGGGVSASAESAQGGQAPSTFLLEHLHLLPKGRALDLAAGRGRHALLLAKKGFAVEAIDRDADALEELAGRAQRAGVQIQTTNLDLERDPQHPLDLGEARYDVILVFFYLHRPLFPALVRALRPGGMLVYETFTVDNHLRHQHPRRKEFCLLPNELLALTQGLRVRYYSEGQHPSPAAPPSPDPVPYTARLIAEKDPSHGSY